MTRSDLSRHASPLQLVRMRSAIHFPSDVAVAQRLSDFPLDVARAQHEAQQQLNT